MNTPRLLASAAILLAVAPAAAHACSRFGFSTQQSAREAHLIATVGADTVLAGAGDVRYVASPGHFGPAGERTIYGQVVEVERIGGLAARGLDPSVKRVVLVPWDYGADCTTTPWMRSARWVAPGTHGLFIASLRDRAHWAGGLPTFDVHWPGSNPYPRRAQFGLYRKLTADSLLSMEDYFSVLDLLPTEDQAASSAEDAFRPLFDWARRMPDVAHLYPAGAILLAARHEIAYARLRSISPPLGGTYRFEVRLGSEPPRVFYARTRNRPVNWWHLGGYREGEGKKNRSIAEGYYLPASGSLSPDSLPLDCGPGRQMSREGSMSLLKASEPGTDVLTWRGLIHASLVARQFPADSALQQFEQSDFARSRERYGRGEPAETPARFVLARDGTMRVEQTIRLDDGRTLWLAGTRISRATIADPFDSRMNPCHSAGRR